MTDDLKPGAPPDEDEGTPGPDEPIEGAEDLPDDVRSGDVDGPEDDDR